MVWLPVRAFLRPDTPSRTPIFSQAVVRVLTVIFLLVAAVWLLSGIDSALVDGREMVTQDIIATPPSPIGDFLYWPYYFGAWLADVFLNNWLSSARLVSVFWAWLAVVSLMVILRRWANSSLAIGGGILLVSNSWFLNLAKTASPEIMLIAVPLLTGAILIRFWQDWQRLQVFFGLGLVLFIGWFLPVWPWFLIGLFLWQLIRSFNNWRVGVSWAGAILGLGLATAWVLVQTPGLVRIWTGLGSGWLSFKEAGGNLAQALGSLVWRAPHRPYWLADLPLVDVLGVVLLIFGFGALWRAASLTTRLAGLGGIIIWLAIVSLAGVDSPGFFLVGAGVFIVIGVGLVELWAIWQRVFPQNPIAHLVGFGFLISLVGLSAFYQGFKYLVVEPRYLPPETIQTEALIDSKTTTNNWTA